MPFKSQKQQAWAYTKEGTKALGGKKKVAEWQNATKIPLPKYVKNSKHDPMNMLKRFAKHNPHG